MEYGTHGRIMTFVVGAPLNPKKRMLRNRLSVVQLRLGRLFLRWMRFDSSCALLAYIGYRNLILR